MSFCIIPKLPGSRFNVQGYKERNSERVQKVTEVAGDADCKIAA
jgi:hypothetical protein